MTKCQESKIYFNTDALEKILKDPVSVLDNEKLFWETEKAQIYTKQWADYVKCTISYDEWREEISEWITVPPKQRTTKKTYFNENYATIILQILFFASRGEPQQ